MNTLIGFSFHWVILKVAMGDLYGTDVRLRASIPDDIPPDILLPGSGQAPILTPDFVAMRAVVDNLRPVIRKVGRLPLPAPHFAELFPSKDTHVQVASVESRDNETENFISGRLKDVQYVPLEKGQPNKNYLEWKNKIKSVEECQVVRWNFEIALSHIPNIIFRHLAITSFKDEKLMALDMENLLSQIVMSVGERYKLAKTGVLAYFTLPEEDKPIEMTECEEALTFPYQMLVQSLWFIRNLTTSGNDSTQILSGLVDASSNCLGGAKPVPDKLKSCLDFSQDPEDILGLQESFSVFGNDELCRNHLVPDLKTCLAATRSCNADQTDACYCSAGNMVTLSIFTRIFYLCNQIFPRKPFDEMDRYEAPDPEKQNEVV